jgi:hypothetical protein
MMYNIKDLIPPVMRYKGDPADLILLGAGSCISNLLLIPGASKLINSIQYLYGEDELNSLIGPHNHSAVSEEVVRKIIDAKKSDNRPLVVMSAALTTNRYRRGKHHAWIGINCPEHTTKIWHNELEKPFRDSDHFDLVFKLHGYEGLMNQRKREDLALSTDAIYEFFKIMGDEPWSI